MNPEIIAALIGVVVGMNGVLWQAAKNASLLGLEPDWAKYYAAHVYISEQAELLMQEMRAAPDKYSAMTPDQLRDRLTAHESWADIEALARRELRDEGTVSA